MSEQLSLQLDPALPDPPSTLRPMLATPLPAPFDSTDHLFEPAWGGRRALAVVGPAATPGSGGVRLIGEDGAPFGIIPPELAGLAVRVAARSAVLDGELVVVGEDGVLDRDELDRRLAGMPGRPVVFLAFDILDLDGRALLRQPLEARRAALRRVLRPGDEVLALPAIPGEGLALHAAVTAQGLAGILARRRSSPYLPGIRSRLWRSIAADPAGGAAALRPAEPSPAAGPAPVLALIRRLPLGLEPD